MNKLKISLVSLVVGLVLSIPAVAVLAACAETTTSGGKTCTLAGSSCNSDGTVCVCAYICGPAEVEG